MKHCPDPKSDNVYTFGEEGLLINGIPLDCEAIVQAARTRLLGQEDKNPSVAAKHEVYKKAVFGKLEAKDAHNYPAVYCIEKVKNQISKLNEDLYLRAQLDFLQLTFSENLSLLNSMGYQEISFVVERGENDKSTGRLMVEKPSIYTGRPERTLADAKVGPTYPAMKGIKIAMEDALLRFGEDISDGVGRSTPGAAQIKIKTDGSEAIIESQTHAAIGSLFPPEKKAKVIDINEVLAFCETKHSKIVESSHAKNKEADKQSAPVSTRTWGRAFSLT